LAPGAAQKIGVVQTGAKKKKKKRVRQIAGPNTVFPGKGVGRRVEGENRKRRTVGELNRYHKRVLFDLAGGG